MTISANRPSVWGYYLSIDLIKLTLYYCYMTDLDGLAALADPCRQKIVEMLADGELSSGDIAKHFDVSASAISQHLKVLREAKVLRVRVEGQRRMYQLNPDAFEEIADWINRVRRFWAVKLNALETRLVQKSQNKRRRKS
jgi:DNA-binding transcriptional ArsR family regulator